MKAKFNKLDRSKLSKEVNSILDKIKKATDNFKKEDKKAEALFDRLYDKIKEGKPEAIKSTKKPSKTKKKKSSGGNRGVFVKLAKSIRDAKPSMTWNEALKEASKKLKADKEKANKKFASSIQTIIDANKKYFGSKTASSLEKDAKQPAKPIGKRRSKKGKTYYEYRTNRTDVKQPPKSFPMLEKGGNIDLFDNYETLPKKVRDTIEFYMEKYVDGDYTYEDSKNFLEEMQKQGYTFEYGLDNEPYDLRKMSKGGKIGFEGLAKKVAKNYEGKKVKPKFQDEYGKTYDKEEAMQVGRAVAGKVLKQQNMKKMEDGGIVREENVAYQGGLDYGTTRTIAPQFGHGGNVNRGSFNVTITMKDGRSADILPIDVSEEDAQDIADMINNMKPMSARADMPLPFEDGGAVTDDYYAKGGQIQIGEVSFIPSLQKDFNIVVPEGRFRMIRDKGFGIPKQIYGGALTNYENVDANESDIVLKYQKEIQEYLENESDLVYAKGGKVLYNLGRGVYELSEENQYKRYDRKKEMDSGYPNAIEVLSSTKEASDFVNKSYAKGGKVKVQHYGNTLHDFDVKNKNEAEDRINKLLNRYNKKRNTTSNYAIYYEDENGKITSWQKFAKGGKTQGYNARLDESLGNRKGRESTKQQSKKDRRDESKGMEKGSGRRAYSSVSTMDVGDRKMEKGGSIGNKGRYIVSIDGRATTFQGDNLEEAYEEFLDTRSKVLFKSDVLLIDTKNDETIEYYDSVEDREQQEEFAKGGEIEVDNSQKLTHKGKKYLIEWDRERNYRPMKYRTFISEDKVGGKLVSRNKDKKLFDEIYEKLLSKYAKGGVVKVGDKVVITDEAIADSKLKSNYGEVLRIYEEEIYDGAINTLVEVKTNDGKINVITLQEVNKLYAKGGKLDDILTKLDKVRNELVDLKLKADLDTKDGVAEFRKKAQPLKKQERKLEDKLEESGYTLPFAKGGKVKAKKEIVEGLEELEVGLAGASKKHKQQSKLAKQIKDGFESSFEKGGNVPKRFLDEKGERKNDPETIEELTEYVMSLPQTKSKHYNKVTNKYSARRQKLHRKIINEFKDELVCIERDEPIAILMGGSPASGKSTFLRKYAPYLLKEELLRIDADEVRAMLPEYKGWNASATHNETQDIVKTLLSDRTIGIPCKYDVIFDGTMTSPKKYLDLIRLLKKLGYKVFVVFIDKVPKDVIMKRAMDRYKKSGRFVPPFVIEEFFETGKDSLAKVKAKVDGYMIVDGSNNNYKVIEQKGLKLPKTRKYSRLGVPLKRKIVKRK